VNFKKHNFEIAEDYYLKSMKLKEEVQDPKGKAITLNDLGSLYLSWEKYDEALKVLAEGEQIASEIGVKTVQLESYDLTIQVLIKKGEYEKAVNYYKSYTSLNKQLFNEQKNRTFKELELKYGTEKQNQEISLMAEKDKSQSAVVSKQHTLIYSLAIVALLLIVIVLISLKAYNSSRKANLQSQIIIEQKQTMMRELHHRVKNNLLVLSSLLDLQQQRLQDHSTKEAIKAVELRLGAMLLIHQDLYGEKVGAQVELGEYLRKLMDNLIYSFGYLDKVKVNLVCDELSIDADKALSIGFICNEVISNSFKHAFEKTDHPELSIALKREKEFIRLTLGDNGSGMTMETDIAKTNSFGLRLIHMFVKDLNGTVSITSNEKGSRFEFVIPINKIST